jgi:N-methylhydantoinase A
MHHLSVDVGGTFTDLVLINSESGSQHIEKVPSTPGRADSVINGIHKISRAARIDPADIDIFVHGFTVGTNAFLMRRGAKTALVVSRGTRDVLEIGDQLRPHLYRLSQQKPSPVAPRSRVVEVHERLDAYGTVVDALTSEDVERVLEELRSIEAESIAVCLSFAHLDRGHEDKLRLALTAEFPDIPVYLSSDINPQIEEYPRAATTAVAAYVGPVIDRYVANLDQALGGEGIKAPLLLMKSDGGVATPDAARTNPAAMLLSGPAGGVIAGACVAAATGVEGLVTFDMGGTSADFSLIVQGEPRMVTSRDIDGQPLRLPSLDIETISAGGGSIASVDLGGAVKVGPESAGADPGPACYGAGGTQPTVTDAAVVLGILVPDQFLGGDMPLDADLAHKAIQTGVAEPLGLSVEEAALGVIRVACASMNQAIRKLSVERGVDVREFTLMAFGGAGPIYAPFMANDLEMTQVLVPPSPGVYAAQGLLLSDIRHTTQAAWQQSLTKVDEQALTEKLGAMKQALDAALKKDGIAEGDRYFRYGADMRCVGQFHELQVSLDEPNGNGWWSSGAQAGRFHGEHQRVYGHADDRVPVEFVNLRVEAFGRTAKADLALLDDQAEGTPDKRGSRQIYLDAETGFVSASVYDRADLRPGHSLVGPAVIVQRDSTTVLLSGQLASINEYGMICIQTSVNGGVSSHDHD